MIQGNGCDRKVSKSHFLESYTHRAQKQRKGQDDIGGHFLVWRKFGKLSTPWRVEPSPSPLGFYPRPRPTFEPLAQEGDKLTQTPTLVIWRDRLSRKWLFANPRVWKRESWELKWKHVACIWAWAGGPSCSAQSSGCEQQLLHPGTASLGSCPGSAPGLAGQPAN